jgi:nucleotide-binding universal stress UspA family protein
MTEETAYFPKIEHLGEAQPNPAQALVAKTVELLRSKGLRATAIVELGHPTSRIVDAAEEWHADLIVVGSHGRRGLERFLLGSVSEVVARHAHCSVEIIRIPTTR